MMKWIRKHIELKWGVLFVFVVTLTVGLISARMKSESEENELTPVFLHETEEEVWMPRAPLTDDVRSSLSFIIDSLCRITDPAHSLDSFLEELHRLASGRDTTIQIVHLGDSHVQAGFYSGEAMRLLQRTFGNAGRGWIAPYKLARDNEPTDYFITSSKVRNWSVGRCTRRTSDCAWGPGGIGIQADVSGVDFTISIAPNNGAGYEFNQVILYRNEGTLPMLPVGEDERVETVWAKAPYSPGVMVDTFKLPTKSGELQLYTAVQGRLTPASLSSIRNCYYGFVLTNGQPGILYHSIGQNGAMFVNYTNEEYIRQLSLLDPSLLIVTLGTNETFGANFSTSEFLLQVDRFVRLVKAYLPFTALVLSTPAESYRSVRGRRGKRSYKRNENIDLAARAIKEYAWREGVACFDLYGMTGGANSCEQWLASDHLGRDRIHFNVAGYQEQGKLLYKALLRSELDYRKRMSL